MRALLSFMLLLVVSVPAGAAYSADHDPTLIVPSQRIGPASLGMNRAAIDEANRDALCPVLATYDASGHAMWLQTNWGGGCLISDKIQVGLFVGPVFRTFGKPDRIAEDARYPHSTAFWISYQARGIAFRVLGSPSGAIIQTIAVFPGVAARLSNSESRSSQTTDVLLPMGLAWGDNYSTQVIVPGVGIGPARLGMTEAQARRVLEASHLAGPECTVDVLIGHGRVIALGTRFGGCLELPLPPSVDRLIVSGRTVLPEVAGIGGSPAPFVRAFGHPKRFQINSQSTILLWANGLVAQVTMTKTGELITYLAVVLANSVVPPYSILW